MMIPQRAKSFLRTQSRRIVGVDPNTLGQVAELSAAVARLDEELRAARDRADTAQRESASLLARVRRLEAAAAEARSVTESPAAASTQASAAPAAATAADPDAMAFDLLYSAFEEEMRGSRELVRELALPHVETVQSFGADGLAVLDLGCGRGEFLELLGEANIEARGIELNPVSVAECAERGLDAIHGDGIAYLESLEPNSLRGVVSFHVVEHLTPGQRARLMRAAFRAVAPGGGCIFEAPNPENLRVGSAFFWLDPTHLRPIPPRLLVFEAQAAGFERVDILGLAPAGDYLVAPEGTDPFVRDVAERVNSLVSGPMHFAIVARKPLDADAAD